MDEVYTSIYEHISDWSLSLDLRIFVSGAPPKRSLQQRWTRIKTLKSTGGFEIEERWEDVPVIIDDSHS